jgi:hypothetical protein
MPPILPTNTKRQLTTRAMSSGTVQGEIPPGHPAALAERVNLGDGYAWHAL